MPVAHKEERGFPTTEVVGSTSTECSNPYHSPRLYRTRSVWENEVPPTAWECIVLWEVMIIIFSVLGVLIGMFFS